jgi:hypothetical protein
MIALPHGALWSGTVLGRAGTMWAKEGAKESAWRLYQEAQQKFFQPRINQEQANLNSLDGSTLSRDARYGDRAVEN